jgi:hypothetical protein
MEILPYGMKNFYTFFYVNVRNRNIYIILYYYIIYIILLKLLVIFSSLDSVKCLCQILNLLAEFRVHC